MDYELDFPQFLKRFNLYVLPVSTDDIVPGAVLDGGGYFSKGFVYQGHIGELMPRIPDEFWQTELSKANLVTSAVNHNVSLKGKNALTWGGINVGGGLENADGATVRIQGMHARSFLNGKGHASILSLRPILSRLKMVQPESYVSLVNNYIVMDAYYASEVILEFDADRGVDLQAEVEQAGGIQINGDGEAKWKSKTALVVTQNVEVPFAFSGFRVPK
jgi:hypothetical protein